MKYSSYHTFEWRTMTVALFLIAMFQIMIFGFIQTSDDRLVTSKIIPLNLFFYAVMLITSVIHPWIMRRVTLKFALLSGLGSDLLGVFFLWVNESFLDNSLPLLFVSFFFTAIAIVSVINCLVTYLVIECPKSLGSAMIGLFLFANLGMFFETLLLDLVKLRSFTSLFSFIAIFLLLASMLFIQAKFFNPEVPKHLDRGRRGSLIWKEMHYRLSLFLVVMLLYGIVETLFSVWGGLYLPKFMTEQEAQNAITLFWGSMVVGQILLLAPLYFFFLREKSFLWSFYLQSVPRYC